MSLKSKIFNFLTAAVTIFGSVPIITSNAYAAIDDDMKPGYGKYVEDNGDNTYDITLHITGKAKTNTDVQKANVVVVFDISNSMEYCTSTGNGPRNGRSCSSSEGQSRLTAAKAATKSMASTLLSLNSSTHPDVVEMKFISFNTTASNASDTITSYSAAETWINNLNTPGDENGGTNWEAALEAAGNVAFANTQTGEKTYVIFISDGDPTFRDSQGTYSNSYCQSSDGSWHTEGRGSRPRYGTGSSDPCGQNLYYAKQQADAIISAGKQLYSIGIYGDAEKMSEVGGTFIDAKTTDALSNALSDIAHKITNSLSLTEIEFNDGITSLADIAVNGNVANFVYRKGTGWDGNEATLKNLPTWNPTKDGASTATFANKTVTWNLGNNFTLSDGETASVTFTVYPDQKVFDILAELENGTIKYDDLTAAEKSSIIKNNGAYSFQTNTANPTVHYCILTTSSTGTQSKECSTDIMQNSDPQPISATTVSVRKIWDAGLDQSQAEELEDTTITFDLLIDSNETDKSKLEVTNILLNKEDNWAVSDISIAPGIMVSSGHKAYNPNNVIDGYTILDSGHPYYLSEHEIGKHFTLVDYEYHPMYVNGELKNVIFNYDTQGNITGIKKVKSISKTGKAELTATNRLKGGVEIRKEVYVNGSLSNSKTNDTFPITIYLKNAKGENYSSELDTNGDCYLSCISIYDTDTNSRISKQSFENGIIETTIASNQKIIISDLEAGSYYYIKEDTTNLPVGYDKSESGKVSYNIERYTTYEDGEAPSFESKTIDGHAFYPVENNASSKGIIKNYYYTGSVNIAKTVKVSSGNEAKAKAKDFNFDINIYTDNTKRQEISSESFTLKDGDNRTISNIPAGAYYEVNETEAKGFTTTSEGETGTIVKDKTAKAKFTNTYAVEPKTADATARKVFGDYWDLTKINGFDFTLTEISSTTKNYPETTAIRTTATSILPANWQFTITEEGTWVYEIAEAEYNHPGVFPLTDQEVITLTITATDNGDGTFNTIKTYKKNSAEIAEADAQIENTYKTQGTTSATLSVVKTVIDEVTGEHNADFTFILSGDAEDKITFNSAEQTGSFKTLTFDKSGTYHYTITEQNDAQPGWIYDTTTHNVVIEVAEDFTTATLSATVKINDKTTNSTEFINEYIANPTEKVSIILEKNIVALSEKSKDSRFNFTITDSEGEEIDTAKIRTSGLSGEITILGYSFEEIGTYEFTVKEIDDGQKYFDYDTTEHVITIIVEDDNKGQLIATAYIDGEETDTLTITNYYNEEDGQGGIPKTPNTGRPKFTNVADLSTICAFAFSLSSVLLYAVFIKKQHQVITS